MTRFRSRREEWEGQGGSERRLSTLGGLFEPVTGIRFEGITRGGIHRLRFRFGGGGIVGF